MKIDRILLRLHKEHAVTAAEQKQLQQWSKKHKSYSQKISRYDECKVAEFRKVEIDSEFDKFRSQIRKRSLVASCYRISVAAAVVVVGLALYSILFTPSLEELHNLNFVSESDVITLVTSTGETVNLEDHVDYLDLLNKKSSEVVDVITYNTIRVPNGKKLHFHLSDGTYVELNANSELIYPIPLIEKKKRRVYLKKGEAFFKVTKDEQQPFIAKVGEVDVHVLGTEFNINYYGMQQIALLSGKVEIHHNNDITMLEPHQMYVQDTVPYIKQIDGEEILAWREGLFLFKNRFLEDIVTELENWYNIPFVFKDQTVRKKQLYCRLPRTLSLEKLLKVLSENGQIQCEYEDNRVIIY